MAAGSDAVQPIDRTEATPPAIDASHLGPVDTLSVSASSQHEAVSKKLVDGKIIPALDLHDAAPAAAPEPAASGQKDWTVAIDLTETIVPHSGNPAGGGVERALPQLLALAKETEGKSVNFVVHAERLIDEDGSLCQQKGAGKAADCMSTALERQDAQAMTERYFIHDGKIDRLPDQDYIEATGDVEELLKDAAQLAPSKKLGLIIDSHGGGSDGVLTNLGPVTLSDEITGIQQGLAGSGHEKLDLLDFNACDMGQIKVLDASTKVANDVVASSAVEYSNLIDDGQNTAWQMRALLANSKMSGRELGETMVKQADAAISIPGVHNHEGTQTLANYDLTNYQTFKEKLNAFGTALSAAAHDDNNMNQVQADIERTTVPNTGKEPMLQNDRDIKQFAANILQDSEAGRFTGDRKPLEASAKALIESFDSVATAYHGATGSGYEKLGGMTVYLPGSEILDSDKVAASLSPLHRENTSLKAALGNAPALDDKPRLLEALSTNLHDIRPETEQAYPGFAHKIESARDGLDKAKSDHAVKAALKNLQSVIDDAEKSPMGAQVLDESKTLAIYIQGDDLHSHCDQVAPDWDQFIRQVQAKAK